MKATAKRFDRWLEGDPAEPLWLEAAKAAVAMLYSWGIVALPIAAVLLWLWLR